ncbi:hypothetical protein Sps_00539 [Shewanella psychrophila]|uniref:Uncharacterized protein n=1 Tax=Shewanella psychrophila TaxID=225848 RepID=A0A1S6HJM9_9GAMM|nr:hypothetical protein [Shewanella psychrophila]AQS35737.1 hypothetical protein Sps_00539 [Shewanella psychrophila]
MVTFRYDLNQDVIELQASNWCGLEQVYINGKRVSRKLNFGQNSEHNIQLNDGKPFRFQLFIDPTSEEMICRIYKSNSFITSINQGRENLVKSRKLLQNMTIFATLSGLLLLLLN